jgi:c-di-GMP-binding flagellar brake protein YcgR
VYLPDERRKEPRLQVECHVEYRVVGKLPIIAGEALAVDLSEGGCCIRGAHSVAPGDRVDVHIQDEAEGQSTVLSGCRVAWVKDEEFGVQFLW